MTAFALLAALLGSGQPGQADPTPTADAVPSRMKELAWKQRLNELVPLDLSFRDEAGRTVPLRELSSGRPIVLVLAYYRCPQLCNLILNALLEGLRGVEFRPGQEFEVIAVSFDAARRPRSRAQARQLRRQLRAARHGTALALFDGRRAADCPPRRCDRLPLCV